MKCSKCGAYILVFGNEWECSKCGNYGSFLTPYDEDEDERDQPKEKGAGDHGAGL